MTIAERVADFLRLHRGHRLCDDCIAATMGLARRQQSFSATSALGATPVFVRDQDECSECGKTKTTTRAVG